MVRVPPIRLTSMLKTVWGLSKHGSGTCTAHQTYIHAEDSLVWGLSKHGSGTCTTHQTYIHAVDSMGIVKALKWYVYHPSDLHPCCRQYGDCRRPALRAQDGWLPPGCPSLLCSWRPSSLPREEEPNCPKTRIRRNQNFSFSPFFFQLNCYTRRKTRTVGVEKQ